MNSATIVPLIWAYLTFVSAGFLFLEADEELMPSVLSITLGVISSMMCLYSLKRSKPYIYLCGFWKCFFIIAIPLVLFIYFNKNNQEFAANFFGSIWLFNFITFFLYHMAADFKDVEHFLNLKNPLDEFSMKTESEQNSYDQDKPSFSNMDFGSKEEQKEFMRNNNIGQTARFVADSFYNWAQNYNLEVNQGLSQNDNLRDVERVAYHAINIRFINEKEHIHREIILSEYTRSPNSGLIDLVISILKVEAELHLNQRIYIQRFIEVMYEELKKKHISDEMIFGNSGLNISNTQKALTEFSLLTPNS